MKNKYLTGILLTLAFAHPDANAQKVTLDYYFNHEVHPTAAGKSERYHYLWDETANPGFSIFGDSFKNAGARLDTLGAAPTLANLRGTAIYIIVDPDSKKENPHPNYIRHEDILQVTAWVKNGGILVMLANDSANVELPHFNELANQFGIHFNDDLQNHVIDDDNFNDGAILTTRNPLFKTAHKIFMKDACSIALSGPASALLKNGNGAVLVATAKYGKGAVFAAGDPWLYNEYTNGRLPDGFENDKAANDVVVWLITRASK